MYNEVACNNGDEFFVAKYIPTNYIQHQAKFCINCRKTRWRWEGILITYTSKYVSIPILQHVVIAISQHGLHPQR
jgi:hypothetical protein